MKKQCLRNGSHSVASPPWREPAVEHPGRPLVNAVVESASPLLEQLRIHDLPLFDELLLVQAFLPRVEAREVAALPASASASQATRQRLPARQFLTARSSLGMAVAVVTLYAAYILWQSGCTADSAALQRPLFRDL